MAHSTLAKWHTFVQSPKAEILNEILAEDVVFHSPVVWTPQRGKMITITYLMAAAQVFIAGGGFRYIREVANDQHVILEFETEVEGITINGVDMMELNGEGKIHSFKVMVRPLKAVNKIHEKMAEMLEKSAMNK